ncbi:MAG: hypothetical protein HY424_01805 [Candidatus Levybacteria bacterium]|nr:hypothetical protein [Candidatus Levybacteria bacterium]
MPRFEQEPLLTCPVIIKRPTALDLERLFRIQAKRPEVSITCFHKTRRATIYDVIDPNRASTLLKTLKKVDPFTVFQGNIVVHQYPKK